MPEEDEGQRITRLEEQVRSSFYRHRTTEGLLHETAKEVKDLAAISIRHSETIGVLAKCVFGTIGIVLLTVALAVLSMVVRPAYPPTGYRLVPRVHAAQMPVRKIP